jgi:subtilisin family serine protease
MRRRMLFAVPIALLLSLGALPSQAAPAAAHSGNYIVVLKNGALSPTLAAAQARALGGTVSHVYSNALHGFAATLPAAAVSTLRALSGVAYIERDGVVRADTSQAGATWGIDRTDQRNLPLNGTYNYTATGSGVTAYIIDTGIRFTHTQFGGRAVSGVDEIDGGPADDCNGHGTHVSGTVGGSTYGIAKSVRLVAVRVLDCGGSGATSGVIAGIDWVTANHAAGAPAVANMSLGGGASASLDTAVRNSIADGVSYAIAAGNGNALGQPQNSCSVSPARVTQAMTIGASDQTDKAASFSNYGTCVDWFAPGVNVTSSWATSDTATNTISGTSMATPHTAGVAALYLQGNTAASPQTVRDALFALTTKNKITGTAGGLFGGGTPNNHLLFSNL